MPAGTPILVLLAGASASFLEVFENSDLIQLIEDCEKTEAEIEPLRQALVEILHDLVSRDDPVERRFLLALKRDVFNARPIRKRRTHALWPAMEALTDGRLGTLAVAEEGLAARESQLKVCFDEALAAERAALLSFGEDSAFQRGLALASPLVARARVRYAGRRGRRAVAMEKSLLRYATRTAVKISAYSTLTPVTLGEASRGAAVVRFRSGERRADSVVRIKRYLLDPVCRRLFRAPNLMAELAIGLNPTLEVLGQGRCRYLRGRASRREGSGLSFGAAASLVTVELEGDWFDILLEHLGDGHTVAFGEVVAFLSSASAGAEEKAQHQSLVRELVSLGLLEVRPPWPGYTPRLEAELWKFLEALPGAQREVLRPVTESLEAVLTEEKSFSGQRRPEEAVESFPRRVLELHEAVARCTATSDRELPRPDFRCAYEDVVLSATDGEALIDLPLDSLRRAQSAVDPLWRLSSVFSPTHEVILALSAFLERQYGETCSIGLMPLFAATQKLWRQASKRLEDASSAPFDPFGLPAVAQLQRFRERVRRRLEGALVASGDSAESLCLPTTALKEILSEIPEAFQSPVPPALSLQSADASGSSWVAESVFAGVGRLSSRFNSVLPEEQKERFVTAALEACRVRFMGESLELLDLLFTKGNTVNVHWPQTRKVFVGPGESADVSAGRILRPTDLSVRRYADGRLRLVAGEGEPLLPVFLSPMHDSYLPQLWRFMLLFGVPRSGLHLPAAAMSSPRQGVEALSRLVVENLVVRRRRWRIVACQVPDFEEGGGDLADFVRLRRWRRELDLPEQVYVRERVAGDSVIGERFKPQFVDFRSPSLVALLRGTMSSGEEVVLTEALPRHRGYPFDPEEGGPRAFEVVIDQPLPEA